MNAMMLVLAIAVGVTCGSPIMDVPFFYLSQSYINGHFSEGRIDGRATWKISDVEESVNNHHALVRSGTASSSWLLMKEAKSKRSFLQTKLKILDAESHATAGIIWNFIDSQSYWYSEVDMRQSKVAIIQVESGRKTLLQEFPCKVKGSSWLKFRADITDSKVSITVDDSPPMEYHITEHSYDGGIGLWVGGHGRVAYERMYFGQAGSVVSPE